MKSQRWSACLLATLALISGACIDTSSPDLRLSRLELRHYSGSVAVQDRISIASVAFAEGNWIIATPPLTWTSDDPSIGTVDEMGRVTGHRLGSVQVRATAAGGEQGTIGITVRPAGLRITLQSGTATMIAGERSILRAELVDALGGSIASNAPIRWSTRDSGTISVRPVLSASGWQAELVAVSAGLATVTAEAENEVQLYVLAVFNERPPSDQPVQIQEFAFFEFGNMSDFTVYAPALRVTVAEGRTAEILRVDVLVSTQPHMFPALCSTGKLSSGQHEILGPVSYPLDLFESFRFMSPPTVDGLVLLKYRADDGKVYETTTRGGNVVRSAPFAYAAGYRWTACAS
jgi:hypothetical protein